MISIIIPTYNRDEDLEACLRSIRENSLYENEIIVMHPKLSAKTDTICEKFGAISINDGSRNGSSRIKSLWAIINEGIEISTNKFVCWLNDDCLVLKGWDDAVCKYFEKDNKLALLVLRTKGILQNPEFIISVSEYGIPVANYGVLDKSKGYRFDVCFSWYYGDVDLPMQIVCKNTSSVVGSAENMIIHNHRIDLNRKNNDSDPRSKLDNSYFKKKWWAYKNNKGRLVKKNLIEYLKIDRAFLKIIRIFKAAPHDL